MTAPNVPQTICLLALSRGKQPPWFPIATRRLLLRERWMSPRGGGQRSYDITDAGRQALAASPHLVEAQRRLDDGRQGRPWQ